MVFSLYAEFLPASKRGSHLLMIEAFWTLGTLGEALLAWVTIPTLGWRWLLIFSTLPLIGVILFFFILPGEFEQSRLLLSFLPIVKESPRYLLVIGKHEKAQKLLEDIAKTNKSSLPPGINHYLKLCNIKKEICFQLFLPIQMVLVVKLRQRSGHPF